MEPVFFCVCEKISTTDYIILIVKLFRFSISSLCFGKIYFLGIYLFYLKFNVSGIKLFIVFLLVFFIYLQHLE